MLAMTEDAVAAVGKLTTGPDVPAGAGLRISGVDGNLRLSVAASPHGGDSVVDASGARIFVDQNASRMLAGKVLHARTDDTGSVQFSVESAPS
jgi:iron-sulfur cluster assembly protein